MRDRDLAAEIEQRTLLAVIDRGSRDGVPLHAWLARVVRDRVRSHERADVQCEHVEPTPGPLVEVRF